MKLGLLSDAHGNLQGFSRGLDVLRGEGIDELWFLGDAIGYIPDTGVLDLVLHQGINMIRGNHEDMLLKGDYPQDREAVYRLDEIKARLTEKEIGFLAALPDHVRLRRGEQELLLIHGSPSDYVRGYVYPDSALEAFHGESADAVFMGNTHHPFVRREAGKVFVNVGSCGLPRDDSGLGRVAVYDADSGEIEVIGYSLSEAAESVLVGMTVHPAVATKLRNCIGK